MRFLVLVMLTCASLYCQTVKVIPWKPSPILATGDMSGKAAGDQSARQALYFSDSAIFPHLATGGGWETVVVMVNMSNTTMTYKTYFYDQQGNPMTITFREYPSMNIVTTTAISSMLSPGASFNFSLFDDKPNTQVGWAFVECDSSIGRLGGYAVFRQRQPGRPDFEALVPLSSFMDHKFFLPVDEIQGFVTAMAICNPAGNVSTTVSLQMLGLDGKEIASKTLTLPPGSQTAFTIQDQFPQMRDRLGTLYVQGSSNRLSALGLRFNTSGGFAFSSVPIMNWVGMFQ